MIRVRRTLCVIAGAIALGGCGLSRPEVARVGDREIRDADLEHAVALQRAISDLQGAPCGQPGRGEDAAAACDRAALSGELLWLAVAGYADAHRVAPSDTEVDRAVDQLETQVGPDVLDAALRERGLTREDLVGLGRKILTIREVRSAVAGDRIGDAELRAQYQERSLEFTIVQVDHILVETEGQARRIYERVREATEQRFVALARRVSIEPGAKERGGELGSASATTYVPAFARAAVALAPGEVSEPVQTQFGWHVIYLVDKEVTPFEEAKPDLVEPLADRAFQGWLQERARALEIEVDPRFGRFVPATFSVEPVRSTDPEGDAETPTT